MKDCPARQPAAGGPDIKTAKAVMVLGTTSHADKSFLATALCRWYARRGLKVAPFKAQKMSNNARVVVGPPPASTLAAPRGDAIRAWGGPAPGSASHGRMREIGSAQYFQALADHRVPAVRMHPVLLKPEADTASQVVLLGEVNTALTAMPWRARSEAVWQTAREALHDLMAENDVVVIVRTALAARAACLLVTDIDRGDAALLAPGPAQLQALTGVPTVAVLPMWRGHGLPEEDGVFDEGTLAGEGLKKSLLDPYQIDGNAPGLGLLPLVTQFEREKLLGPTHVQFADLAAPWSALNDVPAQGYEIRHGRTAQHPSFADAFVALRNVAGEPIGWQQGSVLGLYAHGLIEQPSVMQALSGQQTRSLDSVFDGLADFIDAHFLTDFLLSLIL